MRAILKCLAAALAALYLGTPPALAAGGCDSMDTAAGPACTPPGAAVSTATLPSLGSDTIAQAAPSPYQGGFQAVRRDSVNYWKAGLELGGGSGGNSISLPAGLSSVSVENEGLPMAFSLERYIHWSKWIGIGIRGRLGFSGGKQKVELAGTPLGDVSSTSLEGGLRLYLGGEEAGAFVGAGHRSASVTSNLNFPGVSIDGGSGLTAEIGGVYHFNSSFFAEGGARRVPALKLRAFGTEAEGERKTEIFFGVGIRF